MTRKVVLTDEAYDALARLKRRGQSFSEVVQELVAHRRPSIRDVGGILAEDAAYWESFAKERQQARRIRSGRVDLQ